MNNEQITGLYILAKYILKKHNIKYDEDLIQDLVINAYSALDKFDEKKGAFSTFVCKAMENKLRMKSREKMASKRNYGIPDLSLDHTYEEYDGNELNYIDIFGCDYNYIKELHNKMLFNEIFPLTNEATRMYYLEGMKQVDIAKILGVSQKKVSFLIKKNIQQIRKYCDENNLEYYY